MQDKITQALHWGRDHGAKVAFAIAVAFFIGSMILALTLHGRHEVDASDSDQEAAASVALSGSIAQVTVDIAGAVVHPGVYQLPMTSRIEQAIIAAGGFDEATVDKNFVAKELNLAAKLIDGQKIYILHQGEDRSKISAQVLTPPSNLQSSSARTTSGKLNVNSASPTELETLPGIGPVTAKKIVDNRPYGSVDELVSKKAISKSVYTKIAESIIAQ